VLIVPTLRLKLRADGDTLPQSRPLFLAHGAGNGHGYTTRPLRGLPSDIPGLVDDDQLRDQADRVRDAVSIRDEPESIGPAIVDGYASIANFHRSQQHALDVAAAQNVRPLLKAEDRLKDIRRRARHSHMDLSHETHLLERDLEKYRRRGQQPPQRVFGSLEKLESWIDWVNAA
jgi:hypothetical protein